MGGYPDHHHAYTGGHGLLKPLQKSHPSLQRPIMHDPLFSIADLYDLFICCRNILIHNLVILLYTDISVMKKGIFTGTLISFFVTSLCISSIAYSETQNRGKRGEGPKCQKECLKEHVEKMAVLDKTLSKTGDRLAYQDQVEQAEQLYARCLTNCREVIPVK